MKNPLFLEEIGNIVRPTAQNETQMTDVQSSLISETNEDQNLNNASHLSSVAAASSPTSQKTESNKEQQN